MLDKPVIDYYFAPMSGYAYLGHARFTALADAAGAEVRYHPLDMAQVFAAAGSFPPAKYPEVRQIHRKADMGRWAERFGLPINTTPAFWPVPMGLACRVIAAAGEAQAEVAEAILAAVWAHDLNISDPHDLQAAFAKHDLDGDSILKAASLPEAEARAASITAKAIELGIFGSPTYVYAGAWYFGQDRLDFLEAALA